MTSHCGSKIAGLCLITVSSEKVRGLTVKLIRSLMVVAFFGISASLALADGVDPLVGIKSGGGSTPITVTNPNPTFSLIVVQDPGDASVCSIAGDTCAVVPTGPGAGMLPVFQNQTGSTLTMLTVFIANGTLPLTFSCNPAETSIFSSCSPTVVAGGTDVTFSGGTGVAPATFGFKGDDDSDDSFCQEVGPSGSGCSDDFGFIGGEFAVDIEGVLSDSTSDLPTGTTIQGATITSTPEPGSALLLLFGAAAFGLAKLVRRGD